MLNADLYHNRPLEPAAQSHDGELARWCVVQTHQHSESLAERHLLSQSFRTYLPKRRRTVRHARSVKTVSSAYFDCYLFVSLAVHQQSWYPINSTVGVRKLVMSKGMPIPAPYGVVESLISATDDDGILHPDILLRPGQRIRIIDGPFSDQLGVLDQVGSAGAVRILLDIMNRSIPITIGRDKLSVIS
ncbi:MULTISPECIES: transcription termination/antitermination NusG family protein [Mesorhizobium]|uniref:Transcriptional antiterminator RfaH n=1 Tax=Mesorhizobium shonense TaxID=1209948 RepID=A0ABV2HTL5_9HYPH|nr:MULTISPECIES: transcription termination/antitermination NusG family protein [unclassified Mesorhizobium]AZO29101.1 transcription antiterminator NusG [Mesorhizobium sp. M1B.F.Ca.ET.045.04.1.1]RWB19886.1 MAG: transcription antiterminator NusG [Mesorhizobium sp.]RWE04061.1 MAG: transcription antiterminator NusG [Mesorhizobium sp.]TIS52338.1 MAG: transcription antiterminator NusG [Mesorhizobium sp.]TIT92993.1 MAG: transcription antiterminator NusG [Mesorhizobium sp.]